MFSCSPFRFTRVDSEPEVNPGRHSTGAEEDVLAAFDSYRGTSVRVMDRNLNISQGKVWITLRNNNSKYPFHGTGVQSLEEQDPHRRIKFLWANDSKFSREGITNFHNCF